MKSPLIFRVFKNEQIHVVKQFVDKDQIIIGHEAEVDIDLDSSEISPIHCLIEKRGQQFFLCDLGSTQGTYKNGLSILDEPILSGEEFSVGPFRVIFFAGTPKPMTAPKPGADIVIEPQKPALDPQARPVEPQVKTEAPQQQAPVVETPKIVEQPKQPEPLKPAEPVKPAVELVKPVEAKKPVEQAKPAPATPVAPKAAQTPPAQQPKPQAAKPQPAVAAPTPVGEKPKIQSNVVASRGADRFPKSSIKSGRKGAKTYAPGSEVKDLRQYIKPGKGALVEVIVSWKERIINTYHFSPVGQKKVGANLDIQIPDSSAPKGWTLLDFSQGTVIRTTSDMKVEILREGELKAAVEQNHRLQQNESVFITLNNGMQLVIRHAPAAPAVVFESPLILSSSEFTGILAALIIAALASLIVSVSVPKNVEKEEEVQRVAQVIFTKPPVPVVPQPPPPPVQNPPPQTPPPKPPEPPKQIVKATEKATEQKNKGDVTKPDQKAQAAQAAGRANEVKPKDANLKAKMFTSTKQGGAIKTGEKAGANAKSADPDPSNTGLLAAFGSGGARSKLDKAYSGSGELLGQGEKASGSSGFNENRAGDDLGSKFKDTGAGGKGTATQGIAGIGTQGRGSGQSAYGSGMGFGSKDQVAIQAGGAEEEFTGSIDKEAVRRVVRSALPSFKACYEREFKKDSKLEGKVVVTWEIHEKGVAKNARVDTGKSTLNNSAVGECVRARLVQLRFPEPPAGSFAEVSYPFLFQGQK